MWLGMRDSNPRSRDQNPLPYHLANPQCVLIVLQNMVVRKLWMCSLADDTMIAWKQL